MNKISPDFLTRSREAFASNRGMTLQDLRDRIAERAAGTARRDLLSALDTTARLYGRDLSQIPATASAVRDLAGVEDGRPARHLGQALARRPLAASPGHPRPRRCAPADHQAHPARPRAGRRCWSGSRSAPTAWRSIAWRPTAPSLEVSPDQSTSTCSCWASRGAGGGRDRQEPAAAPEAHHRPLEHVRPAGGRLAGYHPVVPVQEGADLPPPLRVPGGVPGGCGTLAPAPARSGLSSILMPRPASCAR